MSKDPLIDLAKVIKTKREELGYSTEKLSKLSRVSVKYIEAIEEVDRDELPEEVYLVGFLNLLLKALRLDAEDLIEDYKDKETSHIIQLILEDEQKNAEAEAKAESEAKEKPKTSKAVLERARLARSQDEGSGKYFKVYQLYIFAFVLILTFCFIIIKKFNQNKVETTKPIKNVQSYAVPKKDIAEFNQDSKNAQEKDQLEEPEKKEKREEKSKKKRSKKRKGYQTLDMKVVGIAWFQVVGVEQDKVLFEGDVFPNQEPKDFSFTDKVGFVVATGNAGGFLVDIGKGFEPLGEPGELVKWYYPSEARTIYKKKKNLRTLADNAN